MIGYMSPTEAKRHGFTHHGSYFGIPVWIAPNAGFMVATKWFPMEYVMSAFHVIEAAIRSVACPDDEPFFQFVLGMEIK